MIPRTTALRSLTATTSRPKRAHLGLYVPSFFRPVP